MRTSAARPLRWIAIGYIRVFQGTPLLLQLFLVFFGGDMLGVPLGAWLSASLGFSLNAGAFLGEIWRGAIQAVPQGQVEAARRSACSYPAAHAARGAAAGAAHRDPADRRLSRQPDQEHVARRHHRLRRADPRGADAQQRHLPPVHHLRHRGAIYFVLCWPLTLASRRLERRLAAVRPTLREETNHEMA